MPVSYLVGLGRRFEDEASPATRYLSSEMRRELVEVEEGAVKKKNCGVSEEWSRDGQPRA
jgi:hypothetical protein